MEHTRAHESLLKNKNKNNSENKRLGRVAISKQRDADALSVSLCLSFDFPESCWHPLLPQKTAECNFASLSWWPPPPFSLSLSLPLSLEHLFVLPVLYLSCRLTPPLCHTHAPVQAGRVVGRVGFRRVGLSYITWENKELGSLYRVRARARPLAPCLSIY